MIYGRGGASAEMFMRFARLPVLPVIGDGRQRLQPVHIGDVVATVMACLTAKDTSRLLFGNVRFRESEEYLEFQFKFLLVVILAAALLTALFVNRASICACLGSYVESDRRISAHPRNLRKQLGTRTRKYQTP